MDRQYEHGSTRGISGGFEQASDETKFGASGSTNVGADLDDKKKLEGKGGEIVEPRTLGDVAPSGDVGSRNWPND